MDATYNADHEEQLGKLGTPAVLYYQLAVNKLLIIGMWDDNEVQEQSTTEDNKHGNFFDDQSLTNSLEQYM